MSQMCMVHTLSLSFSFFRKAPCMPEITGVSQTNTSSSSVLVSWTSDNTVANYTVSVIGTVGDAHFCHSNGSSCLVSNLPCGSVYEVSAIASTSAGESMPSYTVPLETGQGFMVVQTVKKPIVSKRKVLKPTVTFKMIETKERETLPSEKTKQQQQKPSQNL